MSGGNNTVGIKYRTGNRQELVEVGVKADFLDSKLRANLALFLVNYKNFQQPAAPSDLTSRNQVRTQLALAGYSSSVVDQLVGPSSGGVISTYVSSAGDVRAKGFELEVTAAPARGLLLGARPWLHRCHSFTRVDPIFLAASNGEYEGAARPKWTVSLNAVI